jgi:hypothetical protein
MNDLALRLPCKDYGYAPKDPWKRFVFEYPAPAPGLWFLKLMQSLYVVIPLQGW